MLALKGINRGRGILTCGGETAKRASGDGFHKFPFGPLTFPLGFVIWDLCPTPDGGCQEHFRGTEELNGKGKGYSETETKKSVEIEMKKKPGQGKKENTSEEDSC